MPIWTTKLPGATSLPVTWSERIEEHRIWACTAAAEEPLVALVIVRPGERVEWIKPSIRRSEYPLDLLVTPLRPEYDGVHFSFGTCCQSRSFYVRHPADSGIPTGSMPERSFTGEAVRLVSLDGEPSIEAGVLPLAKRDVKFGRSGRWNLRAELRRHVSGLFGEALTRGRTGHFGS